MLDLQKLNVCIDGAIRKAGEIVSSKSRSGSPSRPALLPLLYRTPLTISSKKRTTAGLRFGQDWLKHQSMNLVQFEQEAVLCDGPVLPAMLTA